MHNSLTAAYKGRHLLITGGGGYIGSAILEALLEVPCTITVLDRQTKPRWLPEKAAARLQWHEGDVSKASAWQDVVRGVDSIWHLAAIEAPYAHSTVERDYEVNALSVVHMLEACRSAEVTPHVVLSSSANIYGRVATLPVNERTPDNPGRVWSAHKLLAEQYLQVLSTKYSVPATILRLANVYGPTVAPGSDKHIVINKVLRAALAADTITLFANAGCQRDYLYIEDVVTAFLAAGKKPPQPGARYVIGSGEAVTLEQTWWLMAEIIKEVVGKEVTVAVDATRELDEAEYRNFVADSGLFSAATGWRPSTLLQSGLLATAKWLLMEEGKTGMMQSYAKEGTEKEG